MPSSIARSGGRRLQQPRAHSLTLELVQMHESSAFASVEYSSVDFLVQSQSSSIPDVAPSFFAHSVLPKPPETYIADFHSSLVCHLNRAVHHHKFLSTLHRLGHFSSSPTYHTLLEIQMNPMSEPNVAKLILSQKKRYCKDTSTLMMMRCGVSIAFVTVSFRTSLGSDLEMGKDGIPDWLNSSLWSTTLSDGDNRIHRHSTSPTISSNAVSEPIVQPPVPVPSPATTSSSQSTATSPKSKSRDRVDKNSDDNNNDKDQNASSYGGSPDDISRQAQLLTKTKMARKLEKSAVRDNDHSKSESSGLLSRSQVTHGEHPLSLGESIIWNQFFQDSKIIEQIDRDVKRTHPDMNFFSRNSQLAKSNQDALKDILIVFAKLNPGIRYVQGMNEILAPLFYVFRNDPDEEMAAVAEADSFFCFDELLSGFCDHFYKQLDNNNVGIRAIITWLSQFLKEHDEELWRHLEIITKHSDIDMALKTLTGLVGAKFNSHQYEGFATDALDSRCLDSMGLLTSTPVAPHIVPPDTITPFQS
ncbi:Ypt/Rab-GAP domain of gyp1p superfamily protein isoform 2 [Hibiscus syriacus]|uniref:Ypt/Rab-GAP domain of gyp1p superfamily protein isoform 2 n=1 Tax=Hibiscus syriacus TaxID=106335 RepID=A0A6A2WAK7_HIBSY|nr:Ypt/Rab-GAP domain of gyp1p superfamily protein isoform 2 [Hibiscus syriacus]